MESEDLEHYSERSSEAQSNIENVQIESHIDESYDDDDEEEMTPEKLIQHLENAWLNEKFAPELLPHKIEIVECVLEQLSHMEDNLKRIKKGDVRLNIHTMEVSRIRFMISSYLRKRLEKIEEYAIHLLSEDTKRRPEEAFMTPSETKFAREYVSSIESLFTAMVLQHMPAKIREFELNKMASKPNMNKHVFVRANKKNNGILISDRTDEIVDFEEGSQHIIQYSAVAHLVKKGEVQLI